MNTEFKLPDLGENIDSGVVIKVLVSVGDTVQRDQPVIELETDKAAIEVPSSVSGIVKAIHVNEGDEAKVGQVMLTLDAESAGVSPTQTEEVMAEPPRAADVSAMVEKEPTHDKRPPEPPKASKEKGRAAGAPVAARADQLRSTIDINVIPLVPRANVPAGTPQTVVPASPSVRRLARELGVDITHVSGSGPSAQITHEDVKEHVRGFMGGPKSGSVATTQPSPPPPPPPLSPSPMPSATKSPLPDFSLWGEIQRKPMSNVRRKTAEHLSSAWTHIPHVTQFDKADITQLDELRTRYSGRVEAAGGKLTMTAILLKVAASALKVFPQFNASVDMEKKEVIFKKYYHLGVAVDTDRGLLVPVIRDVDRKNIIQLSTELAAAAERARTKKTTLDELQGGTFTITNLGGVGGTAFSPIVNEPEVAILGVSRSSVAPVFVDGQFEPRLMLPLSLSYDHRLIDGADAARFLRWIAEALEQPLLLALEG